MIPEIQERIRVRAARSYLRLIESLEDAQAHGNSLSLSLTEPWEREYFDRVLGSISDLRRQVVAQAGELGFAAQEETL